jgi:selenocysteine-specific elongation factor
MNAIVGTAGHIDHGKSRLVQALTGIATDRLPEEQRRGISIELGFAWLDLPDGGRAGIVDVPGHERFVRQMLAGAQGFDLLLMIVAADDGVMPQTEEHFEICHLLGVRHAIFVITKIDLVAAERVAEVEEEIAILAAGTEFENSPILAVSAASGDGIDELRTRVFETLVDVERPAGSGRFRMPVDRAFVVRGHGVVATGTACGGTVEVGDEVEILPGGRGARVREIQVHEVSVERAFAGQRVALNVAGLEREDVRRGDTIVAAGLNATTERFDAAVEIRPCAQRAVKSHARVRVHLGTRDVAARLVWLDEVAAVEPKSRAYAQLVLREEAVALAGDRFVLRDETSAYTLGGGVVLLARAHRHKRSEGKLSERFEALEKEGPEHRLAALAGLVTALGLTPEEAARGIGVTADEAVNLGNESDELVVLPSPTEASIIALASRYEAYREDLLDRTRAFHKENPSLVGIELERLRAGAPFELDQRLFREVVDALGAEGRLTRRGNTASLAHHRISMSDADESLAAKVRTVIRDAGATPPNFKQLETEFQIPAKRVAEIVTVLVERGEVVKVAPDLAYEGAIVADIESRLRGYLQREEQITAAGFRDLISASRKYSIPLLDYFDRSGVTVRSGDYRRLRSN